MLPMVIFIILVITETSFQQAWFPPYFRFGIKLFSRRIPIYGASSGILDWDRFLTDFESSGCEPSLQFWPLSEKEIAFREKLFPSSPFRSSPVMHGIIRYLPEERVVAVSGFLKWSVLAFIFVVFSMTYKAMQWIIPVLFMTIIVCCYIVQANRYRRVCDALAQEFGQQAS